MRIELPANVKKIISLIEQAGYSAYAVGGCVRDTILGRTPQDWDITTDARPEEVKKIFRRTIDTGIAHGTVTVRMGGEGYEVTTYRIDGDYSDFRHPDAVTFTPELSEDLRRRDFTINAMAYRDRDGLIDLFGGESDLQKKTVRAVGDPKERFTEDALRVLRCFRFASQLGFSVDPETEKEAVALSENLKNISAERLREEYLKTLLSGHPEMVIYLAKLYFYEIFCPDLKSWVKETGTLLPDTEPDKILRLALLFSYPGKGNGERLENAERFFDGLKFDNDTKKRALHFLTYSETELCADEVSVRHFLHDFGTGDIELFYRYREVKDGKDLKEVRNCMKTVTDRRDPLFLSDLSVNGGDLQKLGYRGIEIGRILNRLMQEVLTTPSLNEKETLLRLVVSEEQTPVEAAEETK